MSWGRKLAIGLVAGIAVLLGVAAVAIGWVAIDHLSHPAGVR